MLFTSFNKQRVNYLKGSKSFLLAMMKHIKVYFHYLDPIDLTKLFIKSQLGNDQSSTLSWGEPLCSSAFSPSCYLHLSSIDNE
jgi:hypothetical protein